MADSIENLISIDKYVKRLNQYLQEHYPANKKISSEEWNALFLALMRQGNLQEETLEKICNDYLPLQINKINVLVNTANDHESRISKLRTDTDLALNRCETNANAIAQTDVIAKDALFKAETALDNNASTQSELDQTINNLSQTDLIAKDALSKAERALINNAATQSELEQNTTIFQEQLGITNATLTKNIEDTQYAVETADTALSKSTNAEQLAQEAVDLVTTKQGSQVLVGGNAVSVFDADLKADVTYVDQRVADLVNGAPGTLDTLDEIAAALRDNKDIVKVLEDSIATKANKTDLNDYLPLTGGTVSGDINLVERKYIRANGSAVLGHNGIGVNVGNPDINLFLRGLATNPTYNDKALAFTTDNVASATKATKDASGNTITFAYSRSYASQTSITDKDLNTLFDSSEDKKYVATTFATASSCANSPDPNANGFTLEVHALRRSSGPFRTYVQNFTSNNGKWFRVGTQMYGTDTTVDWSEWEKILTSNLVTNYTNISSLAGINKWSDTTPPHSNLVTLNTIAFWDGRYQIDNNTSNLKYCHKGEILGTKGGQTINGNLTIAAGKKLINLGNAADAAIVTRGIQGANADGSDGDLHLQAQKDYPTKFGKNAVSSLDANGGISLNGAFPQIKTNQADFVIQTSGGQQYDFTNTEFRPTDSFKNTLSIGKTDRKFKDGYFSGTLNASGLVISHDDDKIIKFTTANGTSMGRLRGSHDDAGFIAEFDRFLFANKSNKQRLWIDTVNKTIYPEDNKGYTLGTNENRFLRSHIERLHTYSTSFIHHAVAKGADVSATQYKEFVFDDNTYDESSNKNNIGIVGNTILPSKTVEMYLRAYRNVANTDEAATLSVCCDVNGTKWATAPRPAVGSNTNHIVTTNWAKQLKHLLSTDNGSKQNYTLADKISNYNLLTFWWYFADFSVGTTTIPTALFKTDNNSAAKGLLVTSDSQYALVYYVDDTTIHLENYSKIVWWIVTGHM